MSLDGKGLFKSVGLIVILLAFAPGPAAAQDKSIAAQEASLSRFLDKKGGYRDQHGGYFDPKAQTYTDEKAGVLDNWDGYTYKDGSYKTQYGDYYDAPKREFHLSNGEIMKLDAGLTNADAIKALRETVADAGGFDKDFIRKAMIGTIAKEHPADAPASKKK